MCIRDRLYIVKTGVPGRSKGRLEFGPYDEKGLEVLREQFGLFPVQPVWKAKGSFKGKPVNRHVLDIRSGKSPYLCVFTFKEGKVSLSCQICKDMSLALNKKACDTRGVLQRLPGSTDKRTFYFVCWEDDHFSVPERAWKRFNFPQTATSLKPFGFLPSGEEFWRSMKKKS